MIRQQNILGFLLQEHTNDLRAKYAMSVVTRTTHKCLECKIHDVRCYKNNTQMIIIVNGTDIEW